MSILIDADTTFIVQGITGREAVNLTRECLDYGSGALWSGRLAAMLFSLFQTLQVWDMDPGKWLTEYLSACAKAEGRKQNAEMVTAKFF